LCHLSRRQGDRYGACSKIGMSNRETPLPERGPGREGTGCAGPAAQPERILPIKVPNPPETEVEKTPPEVPKVGSRDAPGG
jgi:hypothetical protein